MQGGDTAQPGGVPTAGRQQGTEGHTGGAQEIHDEQGPGAARGGDRQGQDHGPPEVGGEVEGKSQEKALIRKRRVLSTKPKPRSKPDSTSTPMARPPGALIEAPRDASPADVYVAEIPGNSDIKSRPSHRSKSKYLKIGIGLSQNWTQNQAPHRPSGRGRPPEVAEGGGELLYGQAPGGTWPEQNRAWMERERGRRVRQKLPTTPKSNQRKPG